MIFEQAPLIPDGEIAGRVMVAGVLMEQASFGQEDGAMMKQTTKSHVFFGNRSCDLAGAWSIHGHIEWLASLPGQHYAAIARSRDGERELLARGTTPEAAIESLRSMAGW